MAAVKSVSPQRSASFDLVWTWSPIMWWGLAYGVGAGSRLSWQWYTVIKPWSRESRPGQNKSTPRAAVIQCSGQISNKSFIQGLSAVIRTPHTLAQRPALCLFLPLSLTLHSAAGVKYLFHYARIVQTSGVTSRVPGRLSVCDGYIKKHIEPAENRRQSGVWSCWGGQWGWMIYRLTLLFKTMRLADHRYYHRVTWLKTQWQESRDLEAVSEWMILELAVSAWWSHQLMKSILFAKMWLQDLFIAQSEPLGQ